MRHDDPVPVHRRPGRVPNFDTRPALPVGEGHAVVGWEPIGARLRATGARTLVVESYTGVRAADLAAIARAYGATTVVDAARALRPAAELDALVAPDVTDDPIFGRLTRLELSDFFDAGRLAELRAEVAAAPGPVAVVGTGASLVTDGDVLVYADMPRWEEQLRQRAGESGNLGAGNAGARPSLVYKRSYFVDWRVCDRHKNRLFDRVDFVLDTTDGALPKLVTGSGVRRALRALARRPFRVVPLFDPAPWGGQWMKQVCRLDPAPSNYGWCFDCVPEENSLLIGFGDTTIELPAQNLVLREPAALLGPRVAERFRGEFPIRFDFLDTMGGGNLSLQVHPLTDQIEAEFGLHFTQDESYYLLDAEPDACVYLGVRSGVDREAMLADLRRAQEGGPVFEAERYVNVWPARRHDHFLIPAGTVHCSGAGSMVLEISATPYIFTFKLWDWGRLGLDGRPRPINIDRGERAIRWHRDTDYVKQHLINDVLPLDSGEGWRSERTGLHEAEFIETHRHWFTGAAPHDTEGGVNVLNLVSGEEAVVESPDGAWEPFVVHYAETFVVPAAAGRYTVRPYGRAAGTECATVKAFVRDGG